MKPFTALTLAAVLAAIIGQSAPAVEITVFDGRTSGAQSPGSWYNQGTMPGEDHETEPGTTGSQVWDMEGFHLNGTVLTMVSGYDVRHGQSDGTRVWLPGDLFFDVDGVPNYGVDINATTGNNRTAIPNVFGYDYALRLDPNSLTYQLWALDANAILYDSYFAANQASDPWTYKSGGTLIAPDPLAGAFTYSYSTYNDAINNPGYAYTGGNHYVISLDLAAFLDPNTDQDFYVHYVMECGNDNLMGHGSWTAPGNTTSRVPDAGSALVLLSLGLTGIGAFARRLS